MSIDDIIFKFVLPVLIAGVLFFFLERVNAINKDQKFFKNELAQDIALFAVNIALIIPLAMMLIIPFIKYGLFQLIPYQIFDQAINALPYAVQIFIAVLVLDLIVYWRHRFTHIFFWRFHAVHHNAKEISWSTKLRLHPVDMIVALIFQVVFLHIIGFSGGAIAMAALIMMVVDYWNHSNFKFGFKGPLRFILSTPQYHRWHHAAETNAVNKNYIVCFPFLDVLFGSYYYPATHYPAKVGLFDTAQAKVPKTILGQFLYPFKRKQ